ncbi:hypothetical protein V6B05_01395 [Lactococcus garvieae]|nr:hypothetical protein [Lactococcus garvieae]MCI3860081.1 hypothetical protein [Lactococcus garvieae]
MCEKNWLCTKRDREIEKLSLQIAEKLVGHESIVITIGYIQKTSADWGRPVDIEDSQKE